MDRITFKVNGAYYTVGKEVSPDVTLLDYIRNYLGLPGTKYMCREAGCGACIVAVKNNYGATFSINSCMRPITACHGWEITTIEGLGNRKKGYHPLQTSLAKGNGSQCGYCSPSWVMAMYGLLQANPNITMLELEKSFGSNVCRCTGYRPILETFKKFAKDAPKQIQIPDIEDLRICDKTGEACNNTCSKSHVTCNKNNGTNEEKDIEDDDEWCVVSEGDVKQDNFVVIPIKDNRLWIRVNTVSDIFTVFIRQGTDSYMLINGDTAKGAYPIDEYPRVLIDISGVQELKGYYIDQNLVVNAGTTLTDLLSILQTVSNTEFFSYLKVLYDHIQKVAHIPVRNVGTIAGNLMIKHQHNMFPSDIFLLLETVGGQVTIQNSLGTKICLPMQQFLRTDMKGCVIRNILLPPLADNHRLVTFKIMPRSQSAHAFVNAGFLFKLNSQNIVLNARIVYGGLSASCIRATATEGFLVGKKLFTNETLQAALKILEQEPLVIVEDPPNPSVEYRRKVALGLFYKGLLKLCPKNIVGPRYLSGAEDLHDNRPVSKGVQVFETDASLWPLNQPITKVEALIQCAGEAAYTEDLPRFPNEVFCAFALTTVALGTITSIDTRKARAYPGVIAVYTAKDIPGLNSFTPNDSFLYTAYEELLCNGTVKYFNQPLALVVANSRHVADRAAKLVEATYTNVRAPLLDVKKTRNNPKYAKLFTEIKATEKGTDVTKVIKSENTIYGQYHFVMETLTTVVKPSDEGLDVYSSTQWMEGVQVMIARALNMQQNQIDVHTRRLGGGYGLKLSRSIMGAVAAALASKKLNRPCRSIQSLTTNTRAAGKRLPCTTDFEVGVNAKGVIQYLNYNLYEDHGYITNEQFSMLGVGEYCNAYKKSVWNYKCYDSNTDNASNTWTRAPGTLENIAMSELLMEQISYELGLDPLDVRLANLDPEHTADLTSMANKLIKTSDYKNRRQFVNTFNANNRWKKRGFRFVPIKWTPIGSLAIDINLSVFRFDGTVVITHGGIEMGQGVNTKVAQVAAYLLNLPIDKIIIKGNNTTIAPNGLLSGGSITSQSAVVGVRICCQRLLERLEPIKQTMTNPTWVELINKAYNSNVDLQVHGFNSIADAFPFHAYGVTLAEVEIDVLTGESEILRVDIMEDVGQSISPEIDVGQVEGAFIMGMGYWTCENLVYSSTGELLSDRTWNYFVPQARDIPQDWRIYFRKNSYTDQAIFGSKVVGEPPICMSVVIALALREAVVAARLESGIPTTTWYQEDGPHTVERICLMSSTRITDFKLN